MRWPIRRTGDQRTPAPLAHAPERAASPALPRPTPSTPNSEWSRSNPLRSTARLAPPLTFHGDRFGRSVAGARTIAASMHQRPIDTGRAPSGMLLDATRIESVETIERRVEPDIPPVPAALPAAPPSHRRASAEPRPTVDLVTADALLAFLPLPAVDRKTTSMSWTAEHGFAEDHERAGRNATLRYVPAPGPRRERPPHDLVELVAGATGVHVGDAIIDRSPEVSERADALGAIAYTERATIHLPAELGELGEPATRAIVAHELTHVAQQRRVGAVPAEDSPAGRDLEAQARAVQHAAGRGVRPHFMRARTGSRDTVAGVQRLADDDPYAWQHRDDDPSSERTNEMLGMFGGYIVREGSPLDRGRRDHGGDAWAQSYEQRHGRTLQSRREARYHELREQALREQRTERLRDDDHSDPHLRRADVLALRQAVDDEMPWQFGPPEGVDPYPEALPPSEAGEDDHTAGHHAAHPTATTTTTATTATTPASGTTAARRLSASTSPTTPGAHRARRTGGAHAPGRHGAGHGGPGAEGDAFEWQHREQTEQGTIAALFGGGLFGGLLGLASGPETDADRSAAEAATPRLHQQRQERERTLRHATLRSKLIEARREDTAAREHPIQLTHEEIVDIRRQVDEAMPLQFVTPQYLESREDAQIGFDGTISDADAAAAAAAAAASSPAIAGTGAPGAGQADATAPGATPHTGGGPQTGGDAVDGDLEHRDASAGSGHRAGTAGSLLASTGSALLAGQIADRVGAIGQHEHAHTDQFGLDEEAAGRIFAAASDVDIDVLSRRIWDRVRREMRTELIVDRERAGSLADIR